MRPPVARRIADPGTQAARRQPRRCLDRRRPAWRPAARSPVPRRPGPPSAPARSRLRDPAAWSSRHRWPHARTPGPGRGPPAVSPSAARPGTAAGPAAARAGRSRSLRRQRHRRRRPHRDRLHRRRPRTAPRRGRHRSRSRSPGCGTSSASPARPAPPTRRSPRRTAKAASSRRHTAGQSGQAHQSSRPAAAAPEIGPSGYGRPISVPAPASVRYRRGRCGDEPSAAHRQIGHPSAARRSASARLADLTRCGQAAAARMAETKEHADDPGQGG